MFRLPKKLALALAGSMAFALAAPLTPAIASIETPEAKAEASDAATMAGLHAEEVFGPKRPKPGGYLWRKGSFEGEPRIVISLSEQLAYLYRGEDLVAVAAISSGVDEHPTPKGIFRVMLKKPMVEISGLKASRTG